MQPQLGQTQFYQTNTNGIPNYFSLPWGGSIPFGWTPISKDQYVQGVQNTLNTYDKLKNGSVGPGGMMFDQNQYNRLQSELAQATTNTGIDAPNYRDASFSQFNPNGQPTQENFTAAEKAKQANIPSNLGGTGQAIAAPNLGGASNGIPAIVPQSNTSENKNQGFSLTGENLKIGSAGEDVKKLQQYLAGIGVYQGKVDGIYGPQTQQAVKDFQLQHGQKVDGIVGTQTVQALNSVQSGKTATIPTSNSNNNPASPTGSSNTIDFNGQTYTTSSPEEASFLKNAIIPFLEQMKNQGMVINPDVNLGPDVIAQILEKAKNVVHPEYAQKINEVQQTLSRNVGQSKDAYNSAVAGQEQNFQNTLDTARENYAGNGLAFSGQRAKGELGMQDTQNRNLASLSSQYGNQIGDYARTAEKALGTQGFNNSGFQLPTLNNYTSNLSGTGSFNTSGNVNTGFTPGTYGLGELPQQETASALALRNANVEEASKRKIAGLSYQDLIS